MTSSFKKILKVVNRSGVLKNVISHFPFLYVCLVIYGFISKSSFYYIIDIDIMQYISIGELLLPIIVMVELTYVFLGMLSVFLLFLVISRKKKSKKKNKVSDSQKAKNAPTWLEFTIKILGYLLIVWPIFLVLAVFVNHHLLLKSPYFQVITFLFGLILLMIILVFHEEIKTRQLKNLLAVLIIYTITCSVYFQTMRGNYILQNSPEYDIEFVYNDSIIKSSKKLVYYGKTNSFVFMRDLVDEKTKVFNLDFIPTLTFQKNRESGIFSGIRANKRDWTEHPIYQTVNTQTEIYELVKKVERRSEIFIINDKYLFPKRVEVHSKNSNSKWFKLKPKGFLLYDVDPPYLFIKKENDYKALIIKDRDTLIATNKG